LAAAVALATVWVTGDLVKVPHPASADDEVAGVAMNPTGPGWWEAHADGEVVAREGAPDLGTLAGIPLNAPVVGLAATPRGDGLWVVASDGGVFTLGAARFFGSAGAIPLAAPVVGLAPSPGGDGYWIVASDGGVFSYGRSAFHGSTGALDLQQPIEGLTVTPTGAGYWLAASDGGVFAFGDARFAGSASDKLRSDPIVAVLPTTSGHGYWLATRQGVVSPFGDAAPLGSLVPAPAPVIGLLHEPGGAGYVVVTDDGGVFLFPGDGSPAVRLDPPPPEPTPAAPVRADPTPVIDEPAADEPAADEPAADEPAVDEPAADEPTPAESPETQRRRAPTTNPASSTSAAPATAQQIADDIFRRVNDERAARNLPPLAWDGTLANLASDWSDTMAQTGSFQHRDLQTTARQPGFAGVYAGMGENIAYTTGTRSSGNLHQLWMNSAGHRANILQPGFDAIGIGVTCVNGSIYATENFGRVANSAAPPIAGGTPALQPIVHPDTGGPAC
jgi:uncharacterized protein YkwD